MRFGKITPQQVQGQGVTRNSFHDLLEFGFRSLNPQRSQEFDAGGRGEMLQGPFRRGRFAKSIEIGQTLASGHDTESRVALSQASKQRDQSRIFELAGQRTRGVLQGFQAVEHQKCAFFRNQLCDSLSLLPRRSITERQSGIAKEFQSGGDERIRGCRSLVSRALAEE